MLHRKVAKIGQLWGEKGAYFVLRRAWCRLIYPYWLYAKFERSRKFDLNGNSYRYFTQRYNTAWRNERTVEIAIFEALLNQYGGKRVLEVGNVLSHYFQDIVPGRSHIVVDKYEIAEGVVNEDILSYEAEPFDLIISISTLEHVGWDEKPRDPEKVLRAIDNLKKLVKPGGELVVSMPLAYHPPLDRALTNGEVAFDNVTYLKRMNQFNSWREVPAEALEGVVFNDPYPGASAISVCRWVNQANP
jgi:SAM-dependent methyltransferase